MALGIIDREERKSLLVEWSTAIFAIFWGIWWAYVAEDILKTGEKFPIGDIIVLPTFLIGVIIAIYISLFTYFYVKWMWRIRHFHWFSEFLPLVRAFIPLSIAVFGLILCTYFFYYFGNVTYTQLWHGACLTILWIFTTTVLLFQSDYWL